MNRNEMSSAQKFLEDHDQLQRDLMLCQDENKSLRDQVNQLSNMNSVLAKEHDYWKSRANLWLAHSIAMNEQIQAIKTSITGTVDRALAKALEVTREAQAQSGSDGSTEDERASLQRFIGTTPPRNELR